jgi:hypothetical protein
MADRYTISCRAQVVPECYHGAPTRKQFAEDLPQSEDGTYDGSTIVCDPCYIALMPLTPSGRGQHHELPAAIEKARRGA